MSHKSRARWRRRGAELQLQRETDPARAAKLRSLRSGLANEERRRTLTNELMKLWESEEKAE